MNVTGMLYGRSHVGARGISHIGGAGPGASEDQIQDLSIATS